MTDMSVGMAQADIDPSAINQQITEMEHLCAHLLQLSETLGDRLMPVRGPVEAPRPDQKPVPYNTRSVLSARLHERNEVLTRVGENLKEILSSLDL